MSDQFKKLSLEQQRTIYAWCIWYSKKLDRIAYHGSKEDFNGYEQDLFEAFGSEIKD